MAYDPKNSKHVHKYMNAHYKRIDLSVHKEYYDETLLPACQKAGLPVNTFIKQAITYYIDNMQEGRE